MSSASAGAAVAFSSVSVVTYSLSLRRFGRNETVQVAELVAMP